MADVWTPNPDGSVTQTVEIVHNVQDLINSANALDSQIADLTTQSTNVKKMANQAAVALNSPNVPIPFPNIQ